MIQLTERLMDFGRVTRTSPGKRVRTALCVLVGGLLGLAGTAKAQMPPDVPLPTTTVLAGGSVVVQATNSIEAGSNGNNGNTYVVNAGASAIFVAGSTITLGPDRKSVV